MASQMALQEKVLLGQGAFGLVYRLHAKSRVAVKELRGSREEHERELSALKELAHPNIVNFLDATPDYVPDDPYCYLIFMDYCDYGSLEKVIIDPKIIYTAATIVSWAMEMFGALVYLHKNQIIHRDIKPPNILVADLFRLKLSDFGISRPVDNLVRHEGAGTHGYMAPEILEAIGNRNDTPAKQMRAEDIYKCDTYSAGVVVWEIMKRRIPSRKPIGTVVKSEKPEARLQQLVQWCLVEDCTMRPTAKQILTDLATLRYAYPLDPVMRRSQKRLLKPIGLDGTAAELPVKATTIRFEPSSWTAGESSEPEQFVQSSNPSQLNDIDEDAFPYFHDWKQRITREICFDPIITLVFSCNKNFEKFQARNGGALKTARNKKIAEFWDSYNSIQTAGERMNFARYAEEALARGIILKTTARPKESDFSFSSETAESQQEQPSTFLHEKFDALLEIDNHIQLSCVHFAIQIARESNSSRLSNYEALWLLNRAQHNIEEMANIYTQLIMLPTLFVTDSRWEWLEFNDILFRKDFEEFHWKNSAPCRFEKEPRVGLNIEALRRELVYRTGCVEQHIREEKALLATRIPQGVPKMEGLAIKQVIPDYYFLADHPPSVTCRCVPQCETTSISWLGQPPYQVHECTTLEEKEFLHSHFLYERAFRYLAYWQEIPRSPIYNLLLDVLLVESRKTKNIATYYIPINNSGQIQTHLIGRENQRSFLGGRTLNREGNDRVMKMLKNRVETGQVSAWIGATKVDFSELKVMLEELSKRFRPQEKRSVLLEALVCQMTNNKFDLETVDIEERDKHYRCKMPLLMKQFWRPRGMWEADETSWKKSCCCCLLPFVAFMGLLALPRFHTHWGLALGIWILSGICPAIACCYCMRRCVISIQRKFVFLTPDYEN